MLCYLTDFNLQFKNRETWKIIYTYTTWTVIIQGVTNKLSYMVLGSEPAPIDQYLLIFTPIVAIICSPIIEEVVFRKLIFGYLNVKVGFWLAAITSSIIFATAHANYVNWLGYFLVSMLWSWIYKKTGNIMILIILHISLNTISFIVMSIRGI
jgi:membrane protease YdiL (CAAX protease family)